MLRCPHCQERLASERGPAGVQWTCSNCRGEGLTVPVLRRAVAAGAVHALWRSAQDAPASPRPCAACRRPMHLVTLATAEGDLHLDVCRTCQFVWFDADEMARLPAAPPATPPPSRPKPSREAAIAGVGPAMRRAEVDSRPIWQKPHLWPAALGLPVELHPERRTMPWLTWSTAALVTVVSLLAFADDRWFDLAFVAATPSRLGGITLVTCFFLHASVWHLLSNLWFLWVFGDNVEEFLGRTGWLLLVVASTLAGSLLHMLGAPDPEVPCVGASGGIAGLLTFYALRFPRTKLGLCLWFRFIPIWLAMPAWVAFTLWILLQFVLLAMQVNGLCNVSALAHLGGSAVGLLALLATRHRV